MPCTLLLFFKFGNFHSELYETYKFPVKFKSSILKDKRNMLILTRNFKLKTNIIYWYHAVILHLIKFVCGERYCDIGTTLVFQNLNIHKVGLIYNI